MQLNGKRFNRILSELKKLIFTDMFEINDILYKEGKEADGKFRKFTSGDFFGGKDKHYRFKAEFTIPEEFDSKRVDIILLTGSEGWDAINPQFIFYLDGNIIQGLDVNHKEVTIAQMAVAGTEFAMEFEAYTGMEDKRLDFKLFSAIHNEETEKLYYNLFCAYKAALLHDENGKTYTDIMNYLNNTANIIEFAKVRDFKEDFLLSVQNANDYIEKEFYGSYCGGSDIYAAITGHTHIDVAWLWRLKQTEEKVIRSFSTALNLIEEYPEYIFMSSQPQLYSFLKKNEPELYERLKAAVKDGRWEAEGAMWLEADCNLISGESMVRQILYGKRFFKEEFDINSQILWLPDVFGYSAAMPQILKKSGIELFVTSKISWNEINRIPYDTFMWRGIDGTEVLTQFITTPDEGQENNSFFATYNGKILPETVKGAWDRYRQKEIYNEALIPFGYGDGGGGPTREMLEIARRLSYGIPGVPKVTHKKVSDYAKGLINAADNNPKLPKWTGELYLEFHRGTYTTMARNKKYNRIMEIMLLNTEWALTLQSVLKIEGKDTYKQLLYKNWEKLLLNQFHDILPGSSIKEVYEDSREQYIEMHKEVTDALTTVLSSIADEIKSESDCLVIFNPTGTLRSDCVNYHGKKVYVENIPSKGYKVVPVEELSSVNSIIIEGKRITTPHFVLTFDESYQIQSLIDKRLNREMLSGCGNALQAFDDLPDNYDAWNIDIYYNERMYEITDVTHVETEDMWAAKAIIITRQFLSSTIKQKIIFYEKLPKIDFETYIDWKEKHVLLKTAFPAAVNADKATYDIQFGNVERNNHTNTSWDMAKFEVCAHKWADISQDDCGISLLNNCKYGYDIKGNVIRLTLLRSPSEPNTEADNEEHTFIYSFYPHAGGWRVANTPKLAYELNYPMYVLEKKANVKGALPQEAELFSLDRENAVIEVVKEAEDGEGIILRIYDCFNRGSKVTLKSYVYIKEAYECDLMENNTERIKTMGNQISFELKPYEIKTFRLLL